jgi:hypothetical protein
MLRSKFSRPGWKFARSRNQASRGMIQRMRAGAAPCASSHRQASMPVFPDPTTV